MKETFLKIRDHNGLAAFFDTKYSDLSKILYKTETRYNYKKISILKKNGSFRIIKAPRKKIKTIQKKLSDVLYEIYPVRPSAYGFVKGKNIVQNAEQHIGKTFIFNLDLKNFFDYIHFGRVRNLFRSQLFGFNHSVSTILAQLCCIDNSLPQGAPTSPILSNMISWKLDAQLQRLAKKTNSTYTRYVDDITFSFTCSKVRLPDGIVMIKDGKTIPGPVITQIIIENGFDINYDKVRLKGTSKKMEVTGLTVNKFPNVKRQFIRQISSILHSWEKYGYEATEAEFNSKYNIRHRATSKIKSLKYVVKGKLAFLYSVRGSKNQIFRKLAKQYNALVEDELKFKIYEDTCQITNAVKSLWVIEVYYNEGSETICSQGTGFNLKDFGLITCAHVVSNGGIIYKNIEAFKCDNVSKKYILNVTYLDVHRDIAICEFQMLDNDQSQNTSIELYDGEVTQRVETLLLGFPAYKFGQTHSIIQATVSTLYPQNGIKKFEIDSQIREGNSGGPIIDSFGRLVGVALEGAIKDTGNNAALCCTELKKVKCETNKVAEKVK